MTLGYLGGSRDGPGVRPGSDGHPLGLRFIQMMVYLTDCDDNTHCISFCPESLLQSDPTLICTRDPYMVCTHVKNLE